MAERFEIRHELARDEVSIVHRAFDRTLHREVALKRLSPEAARDLRLARQLVREARAIAQVRSPRVLAIHEVGEDASGPFLSMELARGESLRERIRRLGLLEKEEVVRIGCELCEALAAIHRARLVHGNLELDQVFLDTDGVRLTGFALARTTSERSACLTTIGQTTISSEYRRAARPRYAPDANLDAASDLFALGVLLFECLVGDRVHESLAGGFPDPARLRRLRPDIPRALETVLKEALQRNPALRFQSSADFAAALRASLGPESASERPPARGRRRNLILAGSGLGLVLLATLAWIFRPERANDAAVRGVAVASPAESPHEIGYDRSHALLVGINRYRDSSWSMLETAEAGARAMRDFLIGKESFAPEDVELLLGEEATFQGIRSKLYDLSEVGPEDRVLFYFAGHGVRQETPHGEKSHQGYVVPFDGTSEFDTVIQHSDLENVLAATPAKHFLVILDCCYAGLAVLRSGPAAVSPRFEAATTESAREVLAAGRPGEQVADAFEDSGHSAFTHFLLRGLQGEAFPSGKDFLTAGELASYLQRNVIDATGGRQNPIATAEGLGTFVFGLSQGRASTILPEQD